jgi:hypothetical protein
MLVLMARSDGTARRLVGAMLVAEAFVFYAVPTFAYPRAGQVNRSSMTFLQAHVGNSRFYSMNGLAPNYGTHYGVPTINHNDPLLPQTWTDYVVKKLDPYLTVPLLFLQYRVQGTPEQATPADLFDWNRQYFEALSVKYISLPPLQVPPSSSVVLTPTHLSKAGALALGGNRLNVVVPTPAVAGIRAVGIMQADSGGRADGTLHVRLCSGTDCVTGSAPFGAISESGFVQVPLARILRPAAATLRLEAYQAGWRRPGAVWLYPQDEHFPQQLEYGGKQLYGQALKIEFMTDEKPLQRVYQDDVTSIFEVPDAAPYMDAKNCTLSVLTRDTVDTDCPAASRLVRRELFYPGWSVSINGHPGVVSGSGLFQEVVLPGGRSVVRFAYAPAHSGAAIALWALGLLLLIAGTGVVVRQREGVPR